MTSINTNDHTQNIMTNSSSSSDIPIASSNIGFQLLKKHGWKEGTGLGVSEQGRLEPVETRVKKNKRGLGAETDNRRSNEDAERVSPGVKKKASTGVKKKGVSKKMRKMLEEEKRMQEKEFERAFFREFWPDNV